MKLLQHSWSDMLVLDHIHQRMHNNLPDETTLHNGQKFDLLSLGLLGVPSLADHFNDITAKLQELKFDVSDYICIKFLLLLNPGKIGDTINFYINKWLILNALMKVNQSETCSSFSYRVPKKCNRTWLVHLHCTLSIRYKLNGISVLVTVSVSPLTSFTSWITLHSLWEDVIFVTSLEFECFQSCY